VSELAEAVGVEASACSHQLRLLRNLGLVTGGDRAAVLDRHVIATLAVFAIPLVFGSALQPALLRAMTFMIVASPCAVVLSTMPPLLSAIANAGRHGVQAKSAVVMERLAQVDAVALDKTGA
jgi:cation transport ATPase